MSASPNVNGLDGNPNTAAGATATATPGDSMGDLAGSGPLDNVDQGGFYTVAVDRDDVGNYLGLFK